MNKLYVGIDPSINSTGVCISILDDNNVKIIDRFYIIKGQKLTKKEDAAEIRYPKMLHYNVYDKEEVTDKIDNHENELRKTRNFIKIVEAINHIINMDAMLYEATVVAICQEGISYGSTIRTKSVFDLAGLNFLIREKLIKKPIEYIIATPAEVKKFATGKGNANKDLVILNFRTYYDESAFDIPKVDDIADAFFMAQLAIDYDRKNNN